MEDRKKALKEVNELRKFYIEQERRRKEFIKIQRDIDREDEDRFAMAKQEREQNLKERANKY